MCCCETFIKVFHVVAIGSCVGCCGEKDGHGLKSTEDSCFCWGMEPGVPSKSRVFDRVGRDGDYTMQWW